MMIEIRVDDTGFRESLRRLSDRTSDLRPALRLIGEYLLRSTEERFNRQGPAPDGTPWAPLKAATLRRKKHAKILTESGHLRGSIRYQLIGANAVAVGTNKVYGAIHQLGGSVEHESREAVLHFKKWKRGKNKGKTTFAKAGKAHFGQKALIGPYTARIPARPFLGVSSQDGVRISAIIADYIVRNEQ